jgi:nucleoside-diphosphate-sugar epimerase
LITGSAGFLGSILTRELNKHGHELVLVDLLSSTDQNSRNQFLQLDLSRHEAVGVIAALGPFDAIFHLASQIDFGVRDQSDLFSINVAATQAVVEIARKSSCKKVVFTSSNAIFLGYAGDRPIMDEDPPFPTDAYGRSKVRSEECLAECALDFDTLVFRCPNILDAGRVGMLSIFFDFVLEGRKCWLIGNGSTRYQCLYSIDLVNAMLLSLSLKGSHTFTIGSDNVTSISEMYQSVIDRANCGSRVGHLPAFPAIPVLKLFNRLGLSPIGPYQFRMLTADFVFDCTKVKSLLNWKPTLNNSEMLCRAFDHYNMNRMDLASGTSANSGKASQGIIGVIRRLS